MNPLIKLILNTTTFIIVLIVNYLSSTDMIGQKSVGEISDQYSTVITPAGYAFSIWGLIYLLLILFIGYQWYSWKKKKGNDLIDKIGYYFTLSNLANILWIIFWMNDQITLSLIVMFILLWSLIKLVQRLNLERWNAPFPVILFVWWPLAIYFGWILLAAILNVNIFLISTGGNGVLWGATIRGIVLIVLATVIYLYLIYTRNLHDSALTGVWGLAAIVYKQSETNPIIAVFAIAGLLVLLVNVIYHAYRNRKNSVFKKV